MFSSLVFVDASSKLIAFRFIYFYNFMFTLSSISVMTICPFSGPAQSVVWDTIVPSKKRTCVNRPKPTSIEKLTKDLYTILHEQQSSCISESTEEDILIEIETPMASAEMGHGSVLIRHPGSLVRDEESEASSLSVDNQYYLSEAYSHSGILAAHKVDKDMKLQSFKSDDGRNYAGTQMQGELPKR